MSSPRPARFLLSILIATLLAGGAAGATAAERAEPVPRRTAPAVLPGVAPVAPDGSRHPLSLLGPSRLDAAGLVQGYRAAGDRVPRAGVPLVTLARLYLEEGAALGVRADLAWAQTMVETGWLAYPDHGQVRPGDHNFAGIGAYDGGARGFRYPDARAGVRAQLQLLRQYADPTPLPGALVRAPASKRGAVTTWLEMGNGNWATSPRYAEAVLRVYTGMLRTAGVGLLPDPSWPPAAGAVAPAGATGGSGDPTAAGPAVAPRPSPPRLRASDGLWLVAADGHVYDRGVARFWGSLGARDLTSPTVAVAGDAAGSGYWLLVADGRVGAFGDALAWGPHRPVPGAPAVDLAALPNGSGYWIAHRDGRVRAFGEAPPLALLPGTFLPGEAVVALVAHPSGAGAWLATAAGRVVALGEAHHHGDAPIGPSSAPVVDIAAAPDGEGYWLLAADGTVRAYGTATPHGAAGGADDARGAVALVPTARGTGSWTVHRDGVVVAAGDAPDLGRAVLLGDAVVGATGVR